LFQIFIFVMQLCYRPFPHIIKPIEQLYEQRIRTLEFRQCNDKSTEIKQHQVQLWSLMNLGSVQFYFVISKMML
jgi:hypothetical protein